MKEGFASSVTFTGIALSLQKSWQHERLIELLLNGWSMTVLVANQLVSKPITCSIFQTDPVPKGTI